MANLKSVKVGGRNVVLHELTVQEVIAWARDVYEKMQAATDSDVSPDDFSQGAAYENFLPDCPLDDLARMTDCEPHEFHDWTASELVPVLEAAKEINPFFFQMRERLRAAAI